MPKARNKPKVAFKLKRKKRRRRRSTFLSQHTDDESARFGGWSPEMRPGGREPSPASRALRRRREEESLEFWAEFGRHRRRVYRQTGVMPALAPGIGIADLEQNVIEDEEERDDSDAEESEHEDTEKTHAEDEEAWESMQDSPKDGKD